MKSISLPLAALCHLVLFLPGMGEASPFSQTVPQTVAASNWTYTYLKATEGNKELLREFVEKNWFVMDQIAVERGLFKSFRLIENITESGAPESSEWDYIVAVEYFEDQTYADIREQFEEIRSRHDTVLIAGKGFRDLGAVVRSERIVVH